MGFGTIIQIVRLVSRVSSVLTNTSSGTNINFIISTLHKLTNNQNPDDLLYRLESDERFRIRTIRKMEQLYLKSSVANSKMIRKDMLSARKRDLKKTNHLRSNLLVLFAVCGIVICIGCIVYLRNSLNSELIFLFTNVITFFGSILTDVSIFEFGNNIYRSLAR